jgi:hypothetical protein
MDNGCCNRDEKIVHLVDIRIATGTEAQMMKTNTILYETIVFVRRMALKNAYRGTATNVVAHVFAVENLSHA